MLDMHASAYLVRVLVVFRYYEGGVSSVYFWDLEEGFAGVVLLKKSKFLTDVSIRVARLM